MKLLSKSTLILGLALFIVSTADHAIGQITFPRPSQKQSISQTVGDVEITIVYHRPNVKERKVWGTKEEKPIVTYGQIWRAGANENTTIEITKEVTVSGEKLPKGKYGFHVIPGEEEWILIFNKVNNVWGTVKPKEENDALRVSVKPETGAHQESLTYLFENVVGNSALIVLAWEKVRVPFSINVGDVNLRILNGVRRQKMRLPLNAANYVVFAKLSDQYAEALGWVNEVLATAEEGKPGFAQITYNGGFVKARLLAATGKTQEAIELGERTFAFGKDINEKAADAGKRVPFNPNGLNFLGQLVKGWKAE